MNVPIGAETFLSRLEPSTLCNAIEEATHGAWVRACAGYTEKLGRYCQAGEGTLRYGRSVRITYRLKERPTGCGYVRWSCQAEIKSGAIAPHVHEELLA